MKERKKLVSVGGSYVDINVPTYPIPRGGIQNESELVGGDYELVAGGSAVNFCRRLGRTDCIQPVFVGATGRDLLGQTLRTLLGRDGIEANLVDVDASTPVSFNMTGMNGEHIMLVAGTANQYIDGSILPLAMERLETASYLFLGGVYKLKGLLPHVHELADAAHRKGVQVIVDHGRVPEGTSIEDIMTIRRLVEIADVYLPSRDEFLATWEAGSVEGGLEGLVGRAPRLAVAVKNGAKPVVYRRGGEAGEIQPPDVRAVDVTGAGDTFNAYLIAGLSDGLAFADAVRAGVEAASKKVAGELE